jgi:hypothetical protein
MQDLECRLREDFSKRFAVTMAGSCVGLSHCPGPFRLGERRRVLGSVGDRML